MRQCLEMTIVGQVQGVGFRYALKELAERLGIRGEAWNSDDGEVMVVAVAEKAALLQFLKWCYTGPKGAKVDNVESSFISPKKKYNGFLIRT